jgi:hypothetical protein
MKKNAEAQISAKEFFENNFAHYITKSGDTIHKFNIPEIVYTIITPKLIDRFVNDMIEKRDDKTVSAKDSPEIVERCVHNTKIGFGHLIDLNDDLVASIRLVASYIFRQRWYD